MKTISINIIKGVFAFISSNSNKVKTPLTKEKSFTSSADINGVVKTEEGRMSLAEFQRKAYMGHFMAGPIALMHPELFD